MWYEKSVKQWIDSLLGVIVCFSVLGELGIVFGNIIAREVFKSPILWADEIGQLALTCVAFLGGALAYTRNEYVAIHLVIDRLPKSWRPFIDALGEWTVFFGSLFEAYYSVISMEMRWTEYTPILSIRMSWYVLPLTVGLVLIAVYALLRLLRQKRFPILVTGLAVFIVIGLLVSVNNLLALGDISELINWIVFGSFILQLVLGVPVGFVLPIVSMMYLYLSGSGSLTQIPLTMQNGVLNFVLLAIPFFMMAGYIMTVGGLGKRLADFVVSIIGRVRGGLLLAMVVTMYIFAGLSGSKAADVAAVGSTLNPMLKENGYEPDESAAVLASATVMGETIPPSLPMLILGSITTISIGSLFMAGLLPAAVIAVCLMIAIYIKARSKKTNIQTRGVSLAEIGKYGLIAVPALLVPVVLIGGIVTGIATPTEVSSFAVIYALLVAGLFYREITWSKFWKIMIDTSVMSGMVLFITSAASAFSWTLTAVSLPQKIAQFMISIAGHSSWIFLLLSVIVLIVMGAFMEGIPALLVFAPLLVPIVPQFGIDPLQFGIVIIIAMGLGAFSPPIGIGMYITCSVCGTKMEKTSLAMLPYLAVLFIGLLLVAFIPWFSLVIPKLMHMI